MDEYVWAVYVVFLVGFSAGWIFRWVLYGSLTKPKDPWPVITYSFSVDKSEVQNAKKM